MKILVLSDIHGNLAALEAVAAAECHDGIVCLGDIVGYGPEPGACVRWIERHAQLVVQGNHDRAMGAHVSPGPGTQLGWLSDAMSTATRKQLARADRQFLRDLPRWAFADFCDVRFLLMHATPFNPLYKYLGADAAEWARELAPVNANVALVGNTHLQFELLLGAKRLINPGSVGQPKDGDPRAAYAVIEDGRVLLRRVAYAVERTVAALEQSSAPPDAIAALSHMLRTGLVPNVAPHAVTARRRSS